MRLPIFLLLAQCVLGADRSICGNPNINQNSSAPKSANCGAEGLARKFTKIHPGTTNFQSCRNACLVDTKCKFFAYNFSGNHCSIWQTSAINFEWDSTTNTYFFRRDCFSVPENTYYPINAVQNGDFMIGFNSWANYNPQNITFQNVTTSSGPDTTFVQLQSTYPAGGSGEVYIHLVHPLQICQGIPYHFQYTYSMKPGGSVSFSDGMNSVPFFGVYLVAPNGGQSWIAQTYVINNSTTQTVGPYGGAQAAAGQVTQFSTPITFPASDGTGAPYYLVYTATVQEARTMVTGLIANISLIYTG